MSNILTNVVEASMKYQVEQVPITNWDALEKNIYEDYTKKEVVVEGEFMLQNTILQTLALESIEIIQLGAKVSNLSNRVD